MKHLPKKPGTARSQLKTKGIGAATGKATGQEALVRPFGAHNLPPRTPRSRYGAIVLNVDSAAFWACFYSISFHIYIPPFWNEKVYPVSVYVESI